MHSLASVLLTSKRMVWWDERCMLQSAGGITSSGKVDWSITEDRAPANNHTAAQLHASVDLDDDYLRQLVVEGLERRRPVWRVIADTGSGEDVTAAASVSDLHWGEYERMDWERIHAGDQAASCYCMRKGLIRKAHLAHNLKKWAAKHPGGVLASAVPESYILSIDDEEYIDEALCDLPEVRDMEPGSAVWIAKPSITNQGAGIAVFDSCAGLRSVLQGAPDLREWVVQRYIAKPLLVGGRKFHLRAYVLCVGKLRVYVYSEMLALFAGKPYDTSLSDLSNLASHLTNTCLQTSGTAGSRAANGLPGGDQPAQGSADQHAANSRSAAAAAAGGRQSFDESDVVRLLSELPEVLAAEGIPLEDAQQRVDSLRQQCFAVIGECLEAVSHELTFFPLPRCFELFGFDLMLDADWRLWLLEANAEPDFGQTGERLKGLVAGVVECTLQLVADPLCATVQPRQCSGAGIPTASDGAAHAAELAAEPGASCSPGAVAAQPSSDGGGIDGHSGSGSGSGGALLKALDAARFVEVYSSRAGGALQGASGMRML